MQSIVGGLNGEGWVAGLIRAYAAGSEVDARDSAHFLREYLRISAATLGPDCTARGLRVRSKMASRVGSEGGTDGGAQVPPDIHPHA
jgi:hypothetical protein